MVSPRGQECVWRGKLVLSAQKQYTLPAREYFRRQVSDSQSSVSGPSLTPTLLPYCQTPDITAKAGEREEGSRGG